MVFVIIILSPSPIVPEESIYHYLDDAQKIDTVISMYSLIEYSDAYLRTSGSLWQYYRDESAIDAKILPQMK